jgi:hypothetical protein
MTHLTLAALWNKRNQADPYCELQAIQQIQSGTPLFPDRKFYTLFRVAALKNELESLQKGI